MPYKQVHARFAKSDYTTWQLYLLAVAIVICAGLYLPIPLVVLAVESFEASLAPYDWITVIGIQGVVIGFAAEFLYEQGDRYAKKAESNLYTDKDGFLFRRLAIMIGIAAIVSYAVPESIRVFTDYLVIQSLAAILGGAILLIHRESSHWNVETEAPALAAAGMLAIGPTIL